MKVGAHVKKVSIALAVGAAVLALIGPSPSRGQSGDGQSSSAQGVELADFDGAWVLSSGSDDMDRALDRAADQIDLIIREIARLEIHRRIRPERRVELRVAGDDHVTLRWDDWGPVRLTLHGGSRAIQGPGGERVRASIQFRDGQLVHHHRASNGARYTTYGLSGDARRMTMAVRITSDQLPSDIRYRLHYRRAGS